MSKYELTAEEIQELRAAHKTVKHKTDAYKINAVILLGLSWTIEEVSEALLFDEETIRNYCNKYKDGGIELLLNTNYKGSKPKLDGEQIQKLCEEIDSNIYLTAKDICAYVEINFDIKYTPSGMSDLLHRLNYVYKKPKLVPGNPDINEQDEFIKQYLMFMDNKKDDELVFFMDAVHPTHNAQPAYGWMRKGEDREVKTNSGRDRLNIHGAMNAETYETMVLTTEDSIESETTIELFKGLETTYYFASVIYVILDNARYHFSLEVAEYIKNSKIKLIPLPTYSPELNLIERLWKVFKKNILYNKYYENFEKFKEACSGFFINQDKHMDEIRSIMGEGLEALSA